jgi:hypothetical protein
MARSNGRLVLVFEKNIAVYAPVVHWHNVRQRHSTQFYQPYFWAQSRPLLEKADYLLILTIGWRKSDGVTLERSYARDRGIPERYLIRITDDHLHYVSADDYRIDDEPYAEQATATT